GVSQRREHFPFYFLERKNRYETGNDDQFGKEDRFAHFGAFIFKKAQFGEAVEFIHAYLTGFVIERYEQSFYHHYGPIYDDTKVYSTHRQQVRAHAFDAHAYKSK